MRKKQRKIIVIGKVRTFDDEAWKRLLMAYAYYLHEQRVEHKQRQDEAEDLTADKTHEPGDSS